MLYSLAHGLLVQKKDGRKAVRGMCKIGRDVGDSGFGRLTNDPYEVIHSMGCRGLAGAGAVAVALDVD
jgi:hypothetical protein